MPYKKLLWGFIFMFDLRINELDLLPDFIGYIFFYQGLSMLADENEHFYKGKGLAFPMIFLSIFDLYNNPTPSYGLQEQILGGFSTFFSTVIFFLSVFISILMVYKICMGIAVEAEKIGAYDLEKKSMDRYKLFLLNNFLLFLGFLMPILIIPIIIFSLVSYYLLVDLMNIASRHLD